ncbi:MAG: DUF4331 family protein [Myxococcota bacterium]
MTWKRLGAALVASTLAVSAFAADHSEATSVGVGDPAANIADVYAWHEDGNVVAVLTVDGAKVPVAEQQGTYDRDVLYGVHFDTNDDQQADETIWVRFGQNDAGAWGVQAEGIPGASEPLEGAVESPLRRGEERLWAGLRDDPFFFDLDGFGMTVATGTLSFDSTRDSIAGTNCTAIVVEFPASTLGSNVDVWATTARIGGGS